MSLINQLKSGSVEAYNELFQSFHPKVYRFVLQHLGQEDQAIIATKQVFKPLWEQRHTLETDTLIDQFLFDTSKKYVIDGYRQKLLTQKKYNFVLINALKENQTTLSEATSETLQKALRSMPDRRRAIFEMNKMEGKSPSEISEDFSISEHAVQTHISKAMKFLREKLAEAHDE